MDKKNETLPIGFVDHGGTVYWHNKDNKPPFDGTVLYASSAANQPRPDDFAKIVRASCGRQVLFYKESTEDEGNVLHAVASYGAGQADLKFGGIPDEDFATALDKCGVEYADKVIAETAPFFGGA